MRPSHTKPWGMLLSLLALLLMAGDAPAQETSHAHAELITSSEHQYQVTMGGVADMDNSLTRSHTGFAIGFQNNISLTIENLGKTDVVNPRLVINGRGDWYTFDSLLAEFTQGARDDQDRAYFIWQNLRQNLYTDYFLFPDDEMHDPVKLLNIYGLALCDDSGYAANALFHHAGLLGSQMVGLNGHMQAEAMVKGGLQFLDVDQDCFYLDRENRRPLSAAACALDHDLVRRELNQGPVVSAFKDSGRTAALFGADDGHHWLAVRGHEIAYTLRPGEKMVLRWDQEGKFASDQPWEPNERPAFFGNSQLIYQPRLDLLLAASQAGDPDLKDLAPPTATGGQVAGTSPQASLVIPTHTAYVICGGQVRAVFAGQDPGDAFSLELSLDREHWTPLWQGSGPGPHQVELSLDQALEVHQAPAKYAYYLRVGLASARAGQGSNLCELSLQTDIMAAPLSLPRLRVGENQVRYQDQSGGQRQVRVTHQWREKSGPAPLEPPWLPDEPASGATVVQSLVRLAWPLVEGARAYHLQVSRRDDFAYPYRPSLDVIIPANTWQTPFWGLCNPGETYYWRLRCQDQEGVWGPWSRVWNFSWQGPLPPVELKYELRQGAMVLSWRPAAGGQRPARYLVFASNEKGFSVEQDQSGTLLAEVMGTSLTVHDPQNPGTDQVKVFYRVVVEDGQGVKSGSSAYLELPHPFIYTSPPTQAQVGKAYVYEARSLRSLGDLQYRYESPGIALWDEEINAFSLKEGPAWLSLDQSSGLLRGTPPSGQEGPHRVVILVKNQKGGSHRQEFDLQVLP